MVATRWPRLRSRLAALVDDTRSTRLVGQAATALGTARVIARAHPDAVILGVQLADGPSLALVPRLKALHPAPVVVMVAPYADDMLRQTYLTAGADRFLDSQADFEGLPALLGALRASQ